MRSAVPTTAQTGAGNRHGLLVSGRRRTLGLVAVLGGTLLAVAASLLLGTKAIPPSVVLDALVHGNRTGDGLIVWQVRVPRTIIGIGVGLALGVSGASMQGVTRNPLADPGILGVNAGAAFAVVVAIYVFGVSTPSQYVGYAFVGAAVASVLVYALGATGRDGASPVKLALAGAALSALLIALTTAVLLLDLETLERYRFWVVGTLANRDLAIFWQVAPFLGAGFVIALLLGRSLNVLSLGDDVAAALGANVALSRVLAAVAVVLLTGAAVAAAGPIGFVGLTIPHVARALVGTDYRWIIAYSALLGPILLLVADVLGRLVNRPGELQVGVVTAVIGTPFFIYLLRRRRLAAL